MDALAVRKGLAVAVATVQGLRGVSNLAEAINPPVWVSGEYELNYNKTFRGGTTGSGLVEGVFTGRLYVCRSDDRSGHERLDRYMSESGLLSVKAAIETDTTLGGACKALIVERMHAYGLYAVSSVDYFGAHFDVRVWG
jgi:hypothetical protein